MVNYIESLKYPFLDKKNFLIGFLMSVFWWLIIPMFFVFGYIVESIRETLQGNDNLPNWFTSQNWKKFFMHGIMLTLILMIYILPPVFFSWGATSLMGLTPINFFGEITTQQNIIGLAMFFLSLIFFMIAILFLPIAIILYAGSEDIKYAINLSEIILRLKKGIFYYFKAYLVSFLIFFAILLLFAIPLVSQFIALIFGGFLFYHMLFSARLFAEIFREYGL